jgi:predicted phosphodiesterase
MRYAVISDVHSNREAWRKVKEDMTSQGVDEVFCLGDSIGYGPYPKECLDEVRDLAREIIKGNHEELVNYLQIARGRVNYLAYAGLEHAKNKLTAADLDYVRDLPAKKVLTELNLTLAHGAYTEPSTSKYIETEEDAALEVELTPTRICAIGHTHIPFVYEKKRGFVSLASNKIVLNKSEKYIINVGSVGQPRDRDSRACYVILEYKKGSGRVKLELRRVSYDIKKVKKAFKRFGLPERSAERLFEGR